MSRLIEARGLSLGYGGGPVLVGVDFEAGTGQSVAVLGPNGGGKTTLFRALTGDLEPLAGTLRVAARPAYVPQTDRTRLDFPVSALDVALMGALGRSGPDRTPWWRPPRASDGRAADAALARVGLREVRNTRFGELSGGQRQRVLLARALVQGSAVIVLDEPHAGADPASAERIASVVAELRDEGHLILVSTHDAAGAQAFDRVLCLNRRQIAFGEPARTLTRAALEATYGSEMVVLEGDAGPVHAVAVHHHDHADG